MASRSNTTNEINNDIPTAGTNKIDSEDSNVEIIHNRRSGVNNRETTKGKKQESIKSKKSIVDKVLFCFNNKQIKKKPMPVSKPPNNKNNNKRNFIRRKHKKGEDLLTLEELKSMCKV